MTTKEHVKQVLQKWGMPIVEETDNGVVIRYQMNYIQLYSTDTGECNSLAVSLASSVSTDSYEDLLLALRVCNELNNSIFLIKLYLDEDADLVVSSEFYFDSTDQLDMMLKKLLPSSVMAKKMFTQRNKEYRQASKSAQA